MRISLRFLLFFFLLVAIIGYFILNIFVQEIKPGIRQATEDTLVDTANVLATLAAEDIHSPDELRTRFSQAFLRLNNTPINARIGTILKNHTAYRVYITDDKGFVIFDSANIALGQDYSRWNDVYRTLRGKYGARSTQMDPEDPLSTVMYVAAPIKVDQQIAGVLTVAKPNREMATVIQAGEERIRAAGIILVSIALFLGLIFIWWINHSLKRIERYATDVAAGKKVRPPELKTPELNTLAQALKNMRAKLDGKAYIEQYIHALTHELKSPLAAIQGATEILRENPDLQTQQYFLNNIAQQNLRMQQLVERMLQQAKVESMTEIALTEVDLIPLIRNVLEKKAPQLKTITLSFDTTLSEAPVQADSLLLEQAISNLLDNAIDFTPAKGQIKVTLAAQAEGFSLDITDTGTGIPDYALPYVFDRFYSLPRPDKAKSTGLGLSFVREVALLHQGSITLKNSETGVTATLFIPKTIQ